MNRELKALEEVKTYIDDNITTKYNHVEPEIKFIESALKRLESIDNSNPSKALDRLEYICKILNEKRIDIKWLFKNEYNTIKQALTKAQEMEKKTYLKWEDLEFKDDEQQMKVSLNGSIHTLCYYRNMFGDNLCMIDNTGITIWKENKNFFNDLHLERCK